MRLIGGGGGRLMRRVSGAHQRNDDTGEDDRGDEFKGIIVFHWMVGIRTARRGTAPDRLLPVLNKPGINFRGSVTLSETLRRRAAGAVSKICAPRRASPAASVSQDFQDAHLRTAVEAKAEHVADAARDVEPAIAPAMEAFHIALVHDRRERRADQRQPQLAAVRVST